MQSLIVSKRLAMQVHQLTQNAVGKIIKIFLQYWKQNNQFKNLNL